MARFFDPPQAKPLLPKEKIDKVYKSMRFKVFMGSFLGYAAYYLVRKNLSLAAPGMIEDGLVDKAGVGIAMSAVSIAYAFSKFIMGSVSDRSDARKFLVVGLILSALTMMSVGLIPFGANQAVNVAIIFALMLVVGWLSESQMMKATEDIVHMDLDFLPLKSYANIVEANALRIDWNTVIPKEKLHYIMGNPPFVGARLMGRAAKRLSEATGEDARTIHRLLDLDYKDGQGCFTYNDQTRLPADVIIVDEMSMVDEYVFNSLVKAINNGARLVLVGDKDQLASVGAGNVLGDLIASGKFPVSYLTQIYRQSEDSHIIPNAHKINNGEMPLMDNKSKDFFFEEKASAEEIARTTIDLVTKRLPKYLGVRPDEIQVLCPMKRGSAGIYVLNRHLQAVLNPPSKEKKEFRCGEFVFREGDKVMQMQNNYQQEWTQTVGFKVERGLGVYNGDIGVIESINMHIMQFIVRFEDDKVAIYQYEDAEQLALAYAVTIHKSQGSEFDAVVIALDANYMLQSRNLLYTAVTRAKKLVVIAGSRATVGRMVKNNETARRYSLLVNLINDELCGVHRQ